MDKRILFVIIYILGDLFYVYISKSVYDKAVMKIQGSTMPSSRSRISIRQVLTL